MNIPEKMRYVSVSKPGGPEVLEIRECSIPRYGKDEVLIKVAGAGLNGADLTQRKGEYPLPPGAGNILGLEASGTVLAVGQNVTKLKKGDEVCALLKGGGYAEYVCAPALQCLSIPSGVSLLDAGALPETFCTVYTNLIDRGALRKGECVLIQGGTSGIGYTAIQIAKFIGAKVLATGRTIEKCDAIRRFGADRAINYVEEDFEIIANDFTDGNGVDVILDIVGGPYIPKELNILAKNGRLVFVNLRAGKVGEADFGQIHAKHLTVTGSRLRPRSIAEKAAICRSLQQKIWPAFGTGDIEVEVFRRFSFEKAAEAHMLMESSAHIGKILLYPGFEN